jgi:hypothetical protein
VLALACAIGACGTVAAVIPFSAAGVGQATAELEADTDVRFWTELEATYQGQMSARYDVQLVQGGVAVARAACDPFNLHNKVCSVHIEVGEIHRIHCRMQCTAHVPATGPTLVRATLSFGGHSIGLRVRRADLVVKQ